MDDSKPPQPRGRSDSLRAAIDRTLSSLGDARAASATDVPGEVVERAGELLDEVARRGRDARAEIVRRGTGAGAELARRGDEARAEVARRGQEAASASAALGARVLEAVGETLRRRSKPKVEDE